MRVALCVLSTLCLSACSWQGGQFGSGNGYNLQGGSQQSGYYNSRYSRQAGFRQAGYGQAGINPCPQTVPAQPIRIGCESVGRPNGGQYITGNYGSQVANVAASALAYEGAKHALAPERKGKYKKPRLRGSLSLGSEIGVSGTLLDGSLLNSSLPSSYVLPSVGPVMSGTSVGGDLTTTNYFVDDKIVKTPSYTYDDIHPTPWRIAAGGEYIMNNKQTIFANLGYTGAAGVNDVAVNVIGDIVKSTSVQTYDDDGIKVGTAITNATQYDDQIVSQIVYDFSDMRRYDLEVGARHYFAPIYAENNYKTVTPFVSASVGGAHYNALTAKGRQRNLHIDTAYDSGLETLSYEDVNGQSITGLEIFEEQWVPTGSLMGGMEWQATPSSAFALETGIRFEGGREFSSGAESDGKVTVPVTLRGSVNF